MSVQTIKTEDTFDFEEAVREFAKMSERYFLEEVVRSYKWLGHEGKGYTELLALHPDYNPHNKRDSYRRGTQPKIAYALNSEDVVNFVKKYADTHTVCYGINPRPQVYRHNNGYLRASLDSEIELSQNIIFDFDFVNGKVTNHQRNEFYGFLRKSDEYFHNLGLKKPVRAYTNKGTHLLFAYPAVSVKKHPDIKLRLREFRQRYYNEFKNDLSRLEVKLDSTFDLRRMVKIYGTAKPSDAMPSKFFGHFREEDAALREYILSLPEYIKFDRVLKGNGKLPDSVMELLKKDQLLKQYWLNEGKPNGTDQTRSGFDYSLVRRAIYLGIKNIDVLIALLESKPDGSARMKGQRYILHTIGNAITR